MGENEHDFSWSGLGIGGAGKHEDVPIVPTPAQAERMERRERNVRRCRSCGGTSLDGTMFTTAPSSGLSDDCFG